MKNWIRNSYVKLTAYGIIIVCLVVGLNSILPQKEEEELQWQALYYKNYEESNQFYSDLKNYMRKLVFAELYYENEDKIKNKDALREEEIQSKKLEIYSSFYANDISAEVYEDEYGAYTNSSDTSVSYDSKATEEARLTMDEFYEKYPEKEKEIISNLVKSQLLDLKNCKLEVQKNEIFLYDIAEKDVEIEALKKQYKKYPFYLYFTKYEIDSNKSFIRERLVESVNYMGEYNENKALFVGINQSTYDTLQKQWIEKKQSIINFIEPILICLFFFVLAIVFLIAATGKRKDEEGIYFYPIDKLCLELQVAIQALISICGVLLSSYVLMLYFNDTPDLNYIYSGYVSIIILGSLLFLSLFLSQIRRIKAKKFWDGFILIRFLKRAFVILKRAWGNRNISKRAVILSIILPLLCATWIGAPFVILLLIFMINKYISDFIEICEGAKKIRNGDLNYKIIVNKEGELGQLADDINQISQGLENAVSNEIRSERLKSELISNVSHDLKTPLTSIVTYVDLLKQEEINNEAANDYIDVIERKAKRLTELTNDLFEAAKASSGAMPVEIEKIDWNAIIRQGLGEFDEKLNAASLEMRVKLLEKPAYISADGRLLWRVFDNLMGNVVKYALETSRVYINLEDEEIYIHFAMKNISAYELNIPADELMERFKRGDESRNSEGSGLGLSIANSLIDLQKGIFEISIDGDLFRVDIWMPKWREKP